MPTVTSGKVLVIGANGYIAVWVVKYLLEAGFAVRGTVRAEGKATHLRNLFKPHGDKFEIVVVDDITKNEEAVAEVRTRGRAASVLAKYRASKTLAEPAAWDFVTQHRAQIGTNSVDVRDIAQAHVLALQKAEAGGSRYIISAGPYMCALLTWSELIIVDTISAGNTSYDPFKAKHVILQDNHKGIAILDIKYRTLEETTRHYPRLQGSGLAVSSRAIE
ncbi:hypothetical protein BD413DRAFT_490509 [Trametes elegans]|nr:hypothetical protein BD413DRAFT_490509 [Trametes elegans]